MQSLGFIAADDTSDFRIDVSKEDDAESAGVCKVRRDCGRPRVRAAGERRDGDHKRLVAVVQALVIAVSLLSRGRP